MAILGGQGHQREQRPAWVRMAWAPVHLLLTVLVPMLLAAVVLGLLVARDAEPSGFGEPATGLVPGAATVTAWDRDRTLLPDGFGLARDPGRDAPQALVDALIASVAYGDAPPWVRGWIVSEDEDRATARVIVPAPAARDHYIATEFHLRLANSPSGWRVRGTHVRFHCRNDVRDTFYCGI
jgi:hypothetical protein